MLSLYKTNLEYLSVLSFKWTGEFVSGLKVALRIKQGKVTKISGLVFKIHYMTVGVYDHI